MGCIFFCLTPMTILWLTPTSMLNLCLPSEVRFGGCQPINLILLRALRAILLMALKQSDASKCSGKFRCNSFFFLQEKNFLQFVNIFCTVYEKCGSCCKLLFSTEYIDDDKLYLKLLNISWKKSQGIKKMMYALLWWEWHLLQFWISARQVIFGGGHGQPIN